MTRRTFTSADAARFYDRFGKKQDLQFYESAAVDRLLAVGDFGRARALFEMGCGTGRLAERLLRDHLPHDARYVGVDVSATMAGLARARLGRWAERAEVRLVDATQPWPEADGACDRFIAAYVFDLLEPPALTHVAREIQRLVASGGLLCSVAMTHGRTALSRAVSSAWKGVHALSPRIVGGCRPIHVESALDRAAWRVVHQEVVVSWGISSEVLVAARA